MSPDRHERIKRLFLAACELDNDARGAFLDHACGDDAELRAEVESLLQHHSPSSIIELPSAIAAPGTTLGAAPDAGGLRRPVGAVETILELGEVRQIDVAVTVQVGIGAPGPCGRLIRAVEAGRKAAEDREVDIVVVVQVARNKPPSCIIRTSHERRSYGWV